MQTPSQQSNTLTSRLEFEAPPIAELVLGAFFDKVESLNGVYIGQLWDSYRSKFSKTSVHHTLNTRVEDFSNPPIPKPFEVVIPSNSRNFFSTPSGEELIQIQDNRFNHNWRKIEKTDKYPRFDSLFEEFQKELKSLESFVTSEKLGQIKYNQCEITYVNHIGLESSTHNHPERIIKFLDSKFKLSHFGLPEMMSLQSQYVLRNAQGAFARLYIEFEPVFKVSDNRPIYRLKITVRGKPETPDIVGVADFLKIAHDNALVAFKSSTTAEMHKNWGLKE